MVDVDTSHQAITLMLNINIQDLCNSSVLISLSFNIKRHAADERRLGNSRFEELNFANEFDSDTFLDSSIGARFGGDFNLWTLKERGML